MKTLSFSIKYTVPSALFLFTLIISLWSLKHNISRELSELENNALQKYRHSLNFLQENIEEHLLENELKQAENAIISFSSTPDIKYLLVIDSLDTILLSSRRSQKGTTFSDHSQSSQQAAQLPTLITTARSLNKGVVSLGDDGFSVFGVYPIITDKSSSTLEFKKGFIILSASILLERNLSVTRIYRHTLQFFLLTTLFCFLLWIFFHLRLSARINHLIEATDTITSGDFSPQTFSLHGKDEIAQLAHALSDMTLLLSQAKSASRKSHEELEKSVTLRTAELHEAVAQSKSANKAKSIFISRLSHEIRTPLNAILGFAEVLQKNETNSNKLNFLSTIQKSGDSLLSLINDILDLSKIESGKLILQYSPLFLPGLIQEVCDLFSEKIREKNLSFDVTLEPNLPETIVIDGTRLRQVLINLLGNALKFTENGHIARGHIL